MNPIRYSFLRVLALVIVLSGGHSVALAQNGQALLQRVEDRYRAAQSLQADFTQTLTSTYGTETHAGTFYVHGQRYRVEAGPQQFVTDGSTTWMFNRNQNQVVINRFVQDETGFNPTALFTQYTQRYRVVSTTRRTEGGQRLTVLRLAARSRAEFFDEVLLTVRDRDAYVTRLEMRDLNGTRMRYDLRNVQFNPRLAPSLFTFATPRGAQVVDLRS